jgi:hypothetical protein
MALFKGTFQTSIVGRFIDDDQPLRPVTPVRQRFAYALPQTGGKTIGQVFYQAGTLVAGQVDFDFIGGGLLDVNGNPLVLAVVRLLIIENLSTVPRLQISGNMSTLWNFDYEPNEIEFAFPGSPFIKANLISGFPLAAGASDALRLKVEAGETVPYRIWVLGHETYVP